MAKYVASFSKKEKADGVNILFALTSTKSKRDLLLRDMSSLVEFLVKKFPGLVVGLDRIV